MPPILVNSVIWLVLLCVSASVGLPVDFDLDTAAAEPRPIIIETGPSAEALPLVANDETTSGPLSDASEKVEKVLKPAISFSFNEKEEEDREAAATTSEEDQKPKEEIKEIPVVDDLLESGEQAAESKQHHKKEGGGNGHFEKGGGRDFHADHHGEHGERGEKNYKGHHHHEKSQKGHHDKENHKKQYDEDGGHQKKHHHDDGYHGEYHKSHGGKKGAKYKEDGNHNKGHSTKGSHSIHKKDEFEKKTEFFEEDHEGGDSEKHGGYSHSEEYKKGGHHKGGHKKGGHHEEDHGKKSEHARGGHHKEEKGHDHKGGHQHHHNHESKHGHKDGSSKGQKWAFKKSDGDGGGGGGGKHGAHSHQTYAVQAPPPKKEEPRQEHSHQSYAVQSPPLVRGLIPIAHSAHTFTQQDLPRPTNQNYVVDDKKPASYQITPISSVVLPLEEDKQTAPGEILDSYQRRSDIVHFADGKKMKRRRKKTQSSPTDDYLADNPFNEAFSSSKKATPTSTERSMSQLISDELQINQDPIDKGSEWSKLLVLPTEKPTNGPKMIKKRRLKKRPKKTHAKQQPEEEDCPLGHKHEGVLPDESSHSFVIVAAEDADI